MSHNGYDLVVPNSPQQFFDIEDFPSETATSLQRDLYDEDFLCPCLPSYETITFVITHTWDNLTELFFEVLYGDESDIEKDL